MTRDDIIKLAREAGYEIQCLDGIDEVMDSDGYIIQTDLLERFASLVEKKAIKPWADALDEERKKFQSLNELLTHGMEAARRDERAACAKLCEEPGWNQGKMFAKEIRARTMAFDSGALTSDPGPLRQRGTK